MHTFPRMITIVFVKGLGTSLIAFIRFSEIALLFGVSVTQKKIFPASQNCSFVRLTLWPSLARWFKRVTVSATHVTSFRAQINKWSTYFNVFLPVWQSVAEINSLTSRPKAAHFCSVALVDKWGAESSVIKYSCICFADRQAESTHTFSFQKILSNLVKNIFCPATPLFLILRFTLNFNLWRAMQSVRQHIFCVSWYCSIFCQFQNHLCPIRISYLPLVSPLWLKFCTTHLLFLFNLPNGPAVSFRFNLHIRSLAINGVGQVSEHNNACFNALPPSVSHFNGTV